MQAIYTAPSHFVTSTNIEGLIASDIFTLNTTLAATIEESVVRTMNSLRTVWDPKSEYLEYSFVRQSQTFPDVVLVKIDNGTIPLMGIELKGWYLLAKEKQPTYRFTATEKACSPWDLLVVVPWVLSNVLAGSPMLFRPFVRTADHCAKRRNYYWQHIRKTALDKGIDIPSDVHPYPKKSDRISDKAANDSGGNFGRLSRYGIMDDYIRSMLSEDVRGIAVEEWVDFFKQHAKE